MSKYLGFGTNTHENAIKIYGNGATLTNFSGSGKNYTVEFNADNVTKTYSIYIPKDQFKNYLGDLNLSSNIFRFTIDNTRPIVKVYSQDVSSNYFYTNQTNTKIIFLGNKFTKQGEHFK